MTPFVLSLCTDVATLPPSTPTRDEHTELELVFRPETIFTPILILNLVRKGHLNALLRGKLARSADLGTK